jgi:predicted transcriptional regulator YdeE
VASYYGKWQENKDFLITLFEPGSPAIIDHLKPPATRFDDLLLEDDCSSIIHIHKSVFEHFDKQFKNFLSKGIHPSILSHYNAQISYVHVALVEYEKEFMRGMSNTMVEEGNFNKKTYNKKKMDTVREKVREICAMVDLNENSNEED